MTIDNPRAEQEKRWNGPAGHAWVETQDSLDRMFRPFEELLLEAVVPGSAQRVLDVGCGTGGTTLAAARRLGHSGRTTGVDISEPMLAAARARATGEGLTTTFVCANAQDYAFEPASVDLIMSRFGVMFFDDPVAAFSNFRRAAADGAGLRLIAWRSAAENPFMTTAEQAAAPLLPNLPPRRPDVPGQFAFADGERVRSILAASGWTAVDVQPIDVTCTLPEPELLQYVTRLGPVGLALPEVDERTRAHVVRTVRAAFESYVDGTVVRYTAACWLIVAQAS